MAHKYEITPTEQRILVYLASCQLLPCINASYMAVKLDISYSYLCQTLYRMEFHGWIERFKSENPKKIHWRVIDEAVLKKASDLHSGIDLGIVPNPKTADTP